MTIPITRPEVPAYYTGVGGRRVPEDIYGVMKLVAEVLAGLGYILRSGGADGSDKAFEEGADAGGGEKRIWRPRDATPEAIKIAGRYHGAWHLCNEHARKLHGRNVFQVLGRNLRTPSLFVLCWTWDGCIYHGDRKKETGGTGTAISVASENGIPVYNLAREAHYDMVLDWLDNFVHE